VFRKLLITTVIVFPLTAGAELIDPTRPASYTPASVAQKEAGGWKISSIIIGDDRRVAIIDGRSVMQGDELHGMKVISISPYDVILKGNNKEMQISLLPEKVKLPVSGKELQGENIR